MQEKPGKNREQLKEITDRIEAGIRDIFESGDMEKYRNYLRTMSRFHNYSLNNQALIHLQRPDATFVAGYNRWRDKFSRHVLRGEKGITIIAPTPYKKKIEQEKLDPDTKLPILDADGKVITEEKEIEIPMFRPVKVFDYAQTDGKPPPELEQGYPMPDTGIGFLEMYQYGYTDGNAMLPLTKERAMELFMQDVPVFLLYGDNTEAMALDAEDISSHTGVFGVEREEWDAVRGVVTLSEQADTEKLFLENPQDAFLIYQIRRGGELDAYRFMNYDYLQSKGVTPERDGYDAIYTGGFMDYGNARTNLDMIYQRFNVDHPADFKGHSLSVSDIVALKQNGVVSCHYVDSIGFRELPNFLKPENYLKNAEMLLEDDYGMIDGIINNGPKQPTVTELEEQVKNKTAPKRSAEREL